MVKLCCFVDGTGQDTEGDFFLVSVVLKERQNLKQLEEKLLKLESAEKKNFLSWSKFSPKNKISLLQKLASVKELENSIYYSAYKTSFAYTSLTALTIAKSILIKTTEEYIVTVIVDGLNDKEKEIISHELKTLKIRYRKIRGMKDEQNIFLRLAHIFASFLRDYKEKQEYATRLIKILKRVVTEV